jgi:hypothetical protein
MKTIKKIVIPAQTEKTIEKEIYTCDICGKEREHVLTCIICDRHVCSGGYNSHCFHNDPDCFGDYPDQYCLICYDLRFKKYGKEIDQIESEADKKKELIIQKIKEESLKQYENRNINTH